MWVVGINPKTRARLMALAGLAAILAIARYGLGGNGAQTVTGHLKAVSSIDTREKVVALTFDVSWGETVPGQVLDALKKSDTACTFFVSGPWASSHPNLVKRMVSEGHEVASHGFRHVRLTRYTHDMVVEELAKAHSVLHEASGVEPRLFRPPDGDVNDSVVSAALAQGYITVLWSLDSQDLRRPGAQYIEGRVAKRIRPGDIVLFHASDSAPDTPQAIPTLVETLRKDGYDIVTVSRLLEKADGT